MRGYIYATAAALVGGGIKAERAARRHPCPLHAAARTLRPLCCAAVLLMLLLLPIHVAACVSREAARLLATGYRVAGYQAAPIGTPTSYSYLLPLRMVRGISGILAFWGRIGGGSGYRAIVSGILATGWPVLDDLGAMRIRTPLELSSLPGGLSENSLILFHFCPCISSKLW